MANPQKAKGSDWERRCADYLSACEILAERIPAGATMDRGDLFVPEWTIECKNHKAFSLGMWMNETLTEQANRHTPYHALWVHRPGRSSAGDGYFIMTGQQGATIIGELAKVPA